jgi:3-oxoacyl-[acyl-carrier-protein] synthase-3
MAQARALLAGTGISVASIEVDNNMLARVLDTNDEWIQTRSGIKTRYFVEPGIASSDLGAEAARSALADAGMDGSEIDYLVCATMTPDHYFPGIGGIIQHKLGLDPLPALDLRQQCAGFAYGLQVVDALIRGGCARNVLLIGCDVHTSLMPLSPLSWDVLLGQAPGPLDEAEFRLNSELRHLLVLFGDAAGAMVFKAHEADDGRGILGSALYGDGAHQNILHVPGVGSSSRPFVSAESIAAKAAVPLMDGKAVFKLAVTKMPKVTKEILRQHEYSLEDLDLLVMHQANLRINEAAQKVLRLPADKVHNNIQKYGNTTSATLPLCFHEARQEGKAPEGSLVAFTALGAGLHYGSVLMRV